MIMGFAILLVVSAGAAALNVPGQEQEYSREEVESRNRRAVDLTIPRLGDLQQGQSGVLNQNCKYYHYLKPSGISLPLPERFIVCLINIQLLIICVW